MILVSTGITHKEHEEICRKIKGEMLKHKIIKFPSFSCLNLFSYLLRAHFSLVRLVSVYPPSFLHVNFFLSNIERWLMSLECIIILRLLHVSIQA